MRDFEKLGQFYLGRAVDQPDTPLLYDSKDLVTHAVCVGMTGSGKTGLCLGLLEEAAIDAVPAIVIDPKGDLANLLLTFPNLRPEDFRPWINEDDARRKGVSPEEFAAQQAKLWTEGLAKWGQDGARIQRLLDAADFSIYTPGSAAGLGVSVIRSFAAPPQEILDDSELLRDRVAATATALLGLAGIEADPIQSREHILLSNLFSTAWTKGQDLNLAAIIQQIQQPPFERIGVLDVESFYPSKQRFELAMALNNLLASPGFSAWMEGEALDIGNFLHTAQGKPRISIFSIAHLGDAERMFFVSLLLNQVVSWMRTQPGTTSLRAIVYMDEIFGYFPPVANPPSKQPLLTLLKQARAFGVGVVLATQNPVDLDYKGLSNAGTWWVGRLQTERDKARLMDGLEGAAATAGAKFDRQRMEQVLAGLGNRVFLMNNVHEDRPVLMETRWTLSYLRGPLTRSQIKTLMDPRKQAAPAGPAAGEQPAKTRTATSSTEPRPVLPNEIPQVFLPATGGQGALVYHPMLLGVAQVRFADAKQDIDETKQVVAVTPVKPDAVPVEWNEAVVIEVDPNELEKQPDEAGSFALLPGPAAKARSYAAWNKDFVNWLFATQKLDLFKSASLGETSKPGESERDFRVRLQQSSREQRDQAIEDLRRKYAPKITTLQERVRRAEQAVEREAEQAQQQKLQSAVSIGTTLLGAFFGRKLVSKSTIGGLGTAARSMSRSYKESQDVGRATETVEAMKQQLAELDAQFQKDRDELAARMDPASEPLETASARPKKTGISVQLLALAWAPYWRGEDGREEPAWQ